MSQTTELISAWLAAKESKEDADRAASHASTCLTNATNALGKRIMPGKSSPSIGGVQADGPEEVCVWMPLGLGEGEEQLLVVKKTKGYGSGDYDMKFIGEKRKI